MKSIHKGFIIPALFVAAIVALVIGASVYVYKSKRLDVPAVNTEVQQVNSQTNQPINTQINTLPSQTDAVFKIVSPKAGDSWKIYGTYVVKLQNVPQGSFIQGWLQDKNAANAGIASLGIIDTGRNGNPSSNIQVKIPSQWCGGECGEVQYIRPGQYRLLLRVYSSVNDLSYQTYYSDWFDVTSDSSPYI